LHIAAIRIVSDICYQLGKDITIRLIRCGLGSGGGFVNAAECDGEINPRCTDASHRCGPLVNFVSFIKSRNKTREIRIERFEGL
jgi:hypothetical protein